MISVNILNSQSLLCENFLNVFFYLFNPGLNMLKVTLTTCGQLKLAHPTEVEDELVARSLIDVNLPKMAPAHVPIFNGIISDVFPDLLNAGEEIAREDFNDMKNVFIEVCKSRNLQPVDALFEKMVQMFEIMNVMQGVVLIGDPFAGKSVTIKLLASIMERFDYGEIEENYTNRKCTLGNDYDYLEFFFFQYIF